MSQHTSLATEAAKTAVGRNLADYVTGIFAHVNGAYEQHTQAVAGTYPFQINDPPADDSGRARHSFGRTLTIMSTLPGSTSNTDIVVVLPVFLGTTVPTVNIGPPEISTQSASQAIVQGSNIILSITVTGTGPIVYQWRKTGINFSNETRSTLTLRNISETDSGNYTCVAANAGGSVTSQVITLTYTA